MTYLDEHCGLAGKVAVVTGGAGGIGAGITSVLARCGASVAVCDRDTDALAEIAADLETVGHPFLASEVDVRHDDALDVFFRAVDAELGGTQLLVNVPGGTFFSSLMETKRSGVDALVRANFTQVLQVTQLAVERMRDRGGSIVNITSIEGHRAAPMIGVYGAMKAAVESMTRTLALELAPLGIRVNSIAPDMVRTEAAVKAGWFPSDPTTPAAELTHRIAIPMARMGTVEEVGRCAAILLSDLASYVTGNTLFLDGGTRASSGWLHWDERYGVKPPPSVVDLMLGDDAAR